MSVSWPGPGYIDFHYNLTIIYPPVHVPDYLHLVNLTTSLDSPITLLPLILKATMHKNRTTNYPQTTTKKPRKTTKKPYHLTSRHTTHHPTKTHRTTTKRPHLHTTTTRRPHPTKTHRITTKRPHPHTTTSHRPHPTKTHRTTTKRPHPHTTTKPHKPHPTTHRPHTTHKTTFHPHPIPSPITTHHPPNPTGIPLPTTTVGSNVYSLDMTWDDATWILLNSFFIFAMQTGFGMLESGVVSEKNVANIMMKNVVDIVLGGFTYWIFGFSLSYGADPGSNGFAGVGEYVVDSDYSMLGPVMTQFFFQLSFATTATTIVSGTMAERCNFKAYCIFSFLNTAVYSVPCKWIWGYDGWLGNLGCIDIAGSGAVHLLGGVSGYVSAWMLGPRLGRYENGLDPPPLGNPLRCIFGMMILWWGWLAFNCGSTFGITGDLWKFAARASVTTMIAAFAGGLTGSVYTLAKPGNFFDVMDIINPILGALVGITAGCALYHTFDALVVGIIGGSVTIVTASFADWTRVDDPVGAAAVHGFAGIWGMVAVGLFAEDDGGAGFSKGNAGVFRGGTLYLVCIQMLACVSIIAWAAVSTFILLFVINLIVPIRMKPYEEFLGADFSEHLIRKRFVGITPAESAFGSNASVQDIKKRSVVVGYTNPAHDIIIQAFNEINGQHRRWKKIGATVGSTNVNLITSGHKQFVNQESTGVQAEGDKHLTKDPLKYKDNY